MLLQRFKPLPSIGKANDTDSTPVTDTDSAVDLASPTPSSHHTHLPNNSYNSQIGTHCTCCDSQLCLHNDVERDGGGKSNVYEDVPQLSRQESPINHHSKPLTVSPDLCVAEKVGRNGTSINIATKSSHYLLPPEPSPNDAHTVTLCIRLPDGSRVQRRFNFCIDTLQTVVTFARTNLNQSEESSSEQQDSFSDFVLCDNSVPRVVFDDLSLGLEEVGLVHNTMLQFTNHL